MSAFTEIENKILSKSAVTDFALNCRSNNRKVVFTNGCFDILHLGHLDYLSKARDLGDELIIGLNSSASVARLKGPTRPINDERSRAFMLAALSFVSKVVVFDESTPLDLIAAIEPDILVKGGDYTLDTIVGAKEVQAKGGKVQVIPFLDGYSTTNIVTKIENLSKN